MAGMINLDPAKGQEVAEMLTKLCDGEMLSVAQTIHDAVQTMGDDNNIVIQIGDKLHNFQDKYNSECVDAFNSLKAGLEKFTDIAEYISKVQVDTSVKVGETARADVESGAMDAMAGW